MGCALGAALALGGASAAAATPLDPPAAKTGCHASYEAKGDAGLSGSSALTYVNGKKLKFAFRVKAVGVPASQCNGQKISIYDGKKKLAGVTIKNLKAAYTLPKKLSVKKHTIKLKFGESKKVTVWKTKVSRFVVAPGVQDAYLDNYLTVTAAINYSGPVSKPIALFYWDQYAKSSPALGVWTQESIKAKGKTKLKTTVTLTTFTDRSVAASPSTVGKHKLWLGLGTHSGGLRLAAAKAVTVNLKEPVLYAGTDLQVGVAYRLTPSPRYPTDCKYRVHRNDGTTADGVSAQPFTLTSTDAGVSFWGCLGGPRPA
jgi:hypothetical protein